MFGLTWRNILIVIGIMLCPAYGLANTATPAVLHTITVTTTTTDTTGFILGLNKAAPYHYFFLSNPNRVVLDFENTLNKADVAHVRLPRTLVKKVRAGIKEGHDLRLVFDVDQSASVLITRMPATKRAPEQLMVTINARGMPAAKPTYAQSTPSRKTTPKIEKTVKPPVATVSATSIAPRKKVIVIDPGHGGKDPGAVGPTGKQEKDIVLGIARNLYQQLQAQPGVTVHMTRYGDYYVGLRQRLQLARKNKADVFIAIHADAYKDPYSLGASVFALSLRGASSEAARWLAVKENHSELAGVKLDDKGDMLRSVLIDLSQTATISSSLDLGQDVLKQLRQVSTLHKGHVEQAPFVVLKSPDIPSILVETGFISNPREERNLNNPLYQKKIASAIVSGVNQYFAMNKE